MGEATGRLPWRGQLAQHSGPVTRGPGGGAAPAETCAKTAPPEAGDPGDPEDEGGQVPVRLNLHP